MVTEGIPAVCFPSVPVQSFEAYGSNYVTTSYDIMESYGMRRAFEFALQETGKNGMRRILAEQLGVETSDKTRSVRSSHVGA